MKSFGEELQLRTVAGLAAEYPCFGQSQPLKLNIHLDLIERGVPVKLAVEALAAFTTTQKYFKACQAGAARIDLFGLECGIVTEAEHAFANQQLGRLARGEALSANNLSLHIKTLSGARVFVGCIETVAVRGSKVPGAAMLEIRDVDGVLHEIDLTPLEAEIAGAKAPHSFRMK